MNDTQSENGKCRELFTIKKKEKRRGLFIRKKLRTVSCRDWVFGYSSRFAHLDKDQ